MIGAKVNMALVQVKAMHGIQRCSAISMNVDKSLENYCSLMRDKVTVINEVIQSFERFSQLQYPARDRV